jgi:peroxiredoxin
MSTNTLKIGSRIPYFKLKGVDDRVYSLDTFSDKDVLVVIFSCNHCPYVQAYEDRIKEIQSEFGEKGLAVVAVNSNDDSQYPDDSFDNMKKRAGEKNFNFPYLRDEDQTLAKAFDASHTPEIFLFNKNRELVYHGKIDDNWKDVKAVKSKYLREAIVELIQGEEISVPETFSIGCTIKWKE